LDGSVRKVVKGEEGVRRLPSWCHMGYYRMMMVVMMLGFAILDEVVMLWWCQSYIPPPLHTTRR